MKFEKDMKCPLCGRYNVMVYTGGSIPFGLQEIYDCHYCLTRVRVSVLENGLLTFTFIERREKMGDLILRMECPQCLKMDEFVYIGEGASGNRYECPGCGSIVEMSVVVNEPIRKFRETHNGIMNDIQQEWEGDNNNVYLKQHTANDAGIRSSEIAALVGYLIKKGVLTNE